MSRFDNIIQRRLERFLIEQPQLPIKGVSDSYEVVEYRSYAGLAYNGEIIVPPVYDSISFDDELKLAAVAMEASLALLSMPDGALLTDFDFERVTFKPDYKTVILYKDNRKGLFDALKRKVVLPSMFDIVSEKTAERYFWAYTAGHGYVVYDLLANRILNLGTGIEECFDETYGHMFLLTEGKVMMINDDGLEDSLGLREIVCSHGGRVALYNSVRGLSIICDVYGEIIKHGTCVS